MIKYDSYGTRLVYVILHWKSNTTTFNLGNDNPDNTFFKGGLTKASINNINQYSSYNIHNEIYEISGCNNSNGLEGIGRTIKNMKNITYKFVERMNFYFAYSLETMENIDFNGGQFSSTTSAYRGSNLYLLREVKNVRNINQEFVFTNSKRLTKESIINILNALVEIDQPKTLTLGAYNLAKLSNEEKAIATNKGWILA